MSIEFFDILFVAIIAVASPIYGVWDFRRLKARRQAAIPNAGVEFYVTTLIVGWALTFAVSAWWYLANRDFSAIGLGFATEGWGWWVGGSLAVLACVFLVIQSVVVLRNPERIQTVRKQQGSVDLMALIPKNEREARWWPAVSLTAGVCEELLYRGFLIAVFSYLFNTWMALGLSTIIFGLGHFYQGPSGVLKTGFVGLILGALYILTGSLWAPILVHFVLDLNSGVLMRRVMEAPVSLEPAS
ncbi:MAG: CPBP family intramembrane metalloprotease [Candidatus Krumholzibacteria bacterium]|nr:CPBP family intramembrane metalloprotease [Candidatus Krumholzibacteria bacterium]